MSHSLIGADRHTHGKIVAVALASAMSLIMLGVAAWRAETDAPAAHARTHGGILKAGKPALSAAAGAPIVR